MVDHMDKLFWIATVDELLEFKQVTKEKRVSLDAMKFHVHAACWGKQVKRTRYRTGKPPLMVWSKLQKHLMSTFLPHNDERTTYNKLHNLCQGSHTVDEYAEEFSLLFTRTDISDSAEQPVSQIIGGPASLNPNRPFTIRSINHL